MLNIVIIYDIQLVHYVMEFLLLLITSITEYTSY